MIGIDTNVLLRLAAGDDAKQVKTISQWLERNAPESALHINHVVLAESLWALKSGFGYNRDQLASFVEALLANAAFDIEEHGMVEEALRLFTSSKADFPDCLIFAKNIRSCTATITFDKATRGLPGSVVL